MREVLEREPSHQSCTIILQQPLCAQKGSKNLYFLCKITEGGKLGVWVQNDLRVQPFSFFPIKI